MLPLFRTVVNFPLAKFTDKDFLHTLSVIRVVLLRYCKFADELDVGKGAASLHPYDKTPNNLYYRTKCAKNNYLGREQHRNILLLIFGNQANAGRNSLDRSRTKILHLV